MGLWLFNEKDRKDVRILNQFKFGKYRSNIEQVVIPQAVSSQISKLRNIRFPGMRKENHADIFYNPIKGCLRELEIYTLTKFLA